MQLRSINEVGAITVQLKRTPFVTLAGLVSQTVGPPYSAPYIPLQNLSQSIDPVRTNVRALT